MSVDATNEDKTAAASPSESLSAESTELATSVASPHALWMRIKEHKVVQWTLAYAALAYTLLHGAEMLGSSLGWSHGLIRFFTIVLLLGAPIVATIAWYHGHRGQQKVSASEFMIIALLLALGGAFLWRDTQSRAHASGEATTEERARARPRTASSCDGVRAGTRPPRCAAIAVESAFSF